jgi:probable 2-oxoglutarate dehydrogenase E1 component DHKTD1
MRGQSELPDDLLERGFTGDVLSHLFTSPTLQPGEHDVQSPLTVHLLPNPSFLEAVNPVGMGLARALQVQGKAVDASHELGDEVLNIQVHGDAAWAGQGVVAECLNMQSLPHYTVGGTLHLVVNNQLGFTTAAEQGRTGFYATDLAKAISAPIIHVNGDHPQEVAKAVKLAMTYRKCVLAVVRAGSPR